MSPCSTKVRKNKISLGHSRYFTVYFIYSINCNMLCVCLIYFLIFNFDYCIMKNKMKCDKLQLIKYTIEYSEWFFYYYYIFFRFARS